MKLGEIHDRSGETAEIIITQEGVRDFLEFMERQTAARERDAMRKGFNAGMLVGALLMLALSAYAVRRWGKG